MHISFIIIKNIRDKGKIQQQPLLFLLLKSVPVKLLLLDTTPLGVSDSFFSLFVRSLITFLTIASKTKLMFKELKAEH
jgi:hypothetical protein